MLNLCASYRLASTEYEYNRALTFMQEWGYKWHKCSPPKTEGDIIVAWEGTDIIGTVTLDFKNKGSILPLEKIYDFRHIHKYLPKNFSLSNLVQGGRWFASKKNTSRVLLHALAEYCIPKNIEYMIVEVKNASAQRLEEFGIRFVLFCGVRPNLENIPEEGRNYYITEPLPKLALIHIKNLYIENLNVL